MDYIKEHLFSWFFLGLIMVCSLGVVPLNATEVGQKPAQELTDRGRHHHGHYHHWDRSYRYRPYYYDNYYYYGRPGYRYYYYSDPYYYYDTRPGVYFKFGL